MADAAVRAATGVDFGAWARFDGDFGLLPARRAERPLVVLAMRRPL